MSLENIKNLKSEKGFTIVELLIVIVVIGILAAIIIVAYNGVQNQARATQAQSAASTLAKKAEAYNADPNGGNGSYPTALSQLTAGGSGSTYFTSGITVQAAAFTAAPSNPATVRVLACTGGGSRVYYWDYSTGAVSTDAKSPEFGGATDSTACAGTAWVNGTS